MVAAETAGRYHARRQPGTDLKLGRDRDWFVGVDFQVRDVTHASNQHASDTSTRAVARPGRGNFRKAGRTKECRKEGPVRVEAIGTLHFHAPRLIRDIALPISLVNPPLGGSSRTVQRRTFR